MFRGSWYRRSLRQGAAGSPGRRAGSGELEEQHRWASDESSPCSLETGPYKHRHSNRVPHQLTPWKPRPLEGPHRPPECTWPSLVSDRTPQPPTPPAEQQHPPTWGGGTPWYLSFPLPGCPSADFCTAVSSPSLGLCSNATYSVRPTLTAY